MKKVTIKYKSCDEKEFIYDADTPEKTILGFLTLMDEEIGLKINDVLSIKWETINDRNRDKN